MSLDPHWFSTIFGLLFLIGSRRSRRWRFVMLMLALLSRDGADGGVIKPANLHDSASCCSPS